MPTSCHEFLFLLIVFNALSFGTGSDLSRNLYFKLFMKLFSKRELFHFLLLCCRQALFVTLYGLDGFLDSHFLKAYPKIVMNSLCKIFSFHANISMRREQGLCNLPVCVFCLLCEISTKVYGDSLAFSAQICPKKQPEPGMMIKL